MHRGPRLPRPLLPALLLLLPCAPGAAQERPTADAAEPLAYYRMDGLDAIVTRGDVALEMAFHTRRKDDGRAAVEQLVKSELVRRAAERTGAWPKPDEVRRRWDELRRQLRAAGRDPEREPLLRNCSEAALLDYLAVDLAHEQIVRKELGLGDDEQVSPAMLELWTRETRQRATVVDDPDQLPLGTAVRIDGDDVPMLDLGILLLRSSDQDELDSYVRRFVVLEGIDALAREHGVDASRADLERELEARRVMAERDPRFGGLSFEQLLRGQGLTPEWLLKSRSFRAHVLQKKIIARLHPRAALLARAAEDRPAVLAEFGARRRLAIVFSRALDEPNQLVPRDFPAAIAHLETVRRRLETEPFETVAKIESDDAGTKMRGGDCGWLPRRTDDLPEPVLAVAFELGYGEVSPPIRAEDGCYLVKVLGIEPEVTDDTLVERMRERLVEELTRDLLREAEIRRVDGSPLDPKADDR
ncbi:MAG: peptidylprolyl isomerase [Planctomycetota bacterium]